MSKLRPYGEEILLSYTQLDGYEKVEIVQCHWLKSITRRVKKHLELSCSFPFVKQVAIEYTDVLFDKGCDLYSDTFHIYALESPKCIAQKFGLKYPDVAVELVEDSLNCI